MAIKKKKPKKRKIKLTEEEYNKRLFYKNFKEGYAKREYEAWAKTKMKQSFDYSKKLAKVNELTKTGKVKREVKRMDTLYNAIKNQLPKKDQNSFTRDKFNELYFLQNASFTKDKRLKEAGDYFSDRSKMRLNDSYKYFNSLEKVNTMIGKLRVFNSREFKYHHNTYFIRQFKENLSRYIDKAAIDRLQLFMDTQSPQELKAFFNQNQTMKTIQLMIYESDSEVIDSYISHTSGQEGFSTNFTAEIEKQLKAKGF